MNIESVKFKYVVYDTTIIKKNNMRLFKHYTSIILELNKKLLLMKTNIGSSEDNTCTLVCNKQPIMELENSIIKRQDMLKSLEAQDHYLNNLVDSGCNNIKLLVSRVDYMRYHLDDNFQQLIRESISDLFSQNKIHHCILDEDIKSIGVDLRLFFTCKNYNSNAIHYGLDIMSLITITDINKLQLLKSKVKYNVNDFKIIVGEINLLYLKNKEQTSQEQYKLELNLIELRIHRSMIFIKDQIFTCLIEKISDNPDYKAHI